MEMNFYQKVALSTAIFPKDNEVSYLALALCGEAGEVADKVKKIIRDNQGDFSNEDVKKAIALELGDVLWYAANLANTIGYNFEDIGIMNIHKIQSRKDRGTLQGSGDNR